MTCDRCGKEAVGLIGGYAEQAGQTWCVDCADAAGLKLPEAIRRPVISETPNDRAEWLEKKAAEKRARLDAFLAKKKQAQESAEAPSRPILVGPNSDFHAPEHQATGRHLKTAPAPAAGMTEAAGACADCETPEERRRRLNKPQTREQEQAIKDALTKRDFFPIKTAAPTSAGQMRLI